MRAIILAAGQGTRLMPLTAEIPKCMVKLHGKPLIEWQVNALREGGISDIVVIGGYKAEKINISGVRKRINPKFASTNMVSTLFSAEDELEGDVLVAYGDIVYSPEIVRALIMSKVDIAVAIDLDWQKLWALRMEDPLKDAETLKISTDDKILELGKKPKSLDDIQGQYMGLILFRAEVLKRIKKFYNAMDKTKLYDGKNFDNMFMTSFLTEIKDNVSQLNAVKVRGGWCEVDSCKDLEVYESKT